MTLTLSTVEVCGYTGTVGVTDSDINTAGYYIYAETGYTVTQYSDDPTDGLWMIPADVVKRAWSIVAARMSSTTQAASDGETLTSESQGDYSYTVDVERSDRYIDDPLWGLPRTLLQLPTAVSATLRPGQSIIGPRSGYSGQTTYI